ncbi:MAG: NAD-dependent epimerase/dehydratase family protein [Pirellulales bacterium]|nr:NAD-dependent epimerase/dehydratase family protein [Pirellulales bacterium]
MNPNPTPPNKLGTGSLVLVTGGTGAIGPTVVHRLVDAGCRVRLLVWGEMPPAGVLPDDVVLFPGEINDRDSLREALKEVNVVFHLAAKLHINNPDPSLRQEYWRVNVDGTRCLAETAADAGVGRLVHFSTINVYGPSTFPNVFDETSPTNCDSWYAESKLESERIVLDRLPATVLRMAAIYGPRMKGNYVRLLTALKAGRYLPIGSGANRRTLVHQEDVAEAAIVASNHSQAIGQIYNVSDGQIHTLDEIVTAMCLALGRRAPRIRLPVVPVKACASLADYGFRCLGRRPFARSAVEKLLEDMAVDASKIQTQLGYRPHYDLQKGWSTIAS